MPRPPGWSNPPERSEGMIAIISFLAAVSAVSAMQKALDSDAEWTMERRLKGSTRTLVSSGTVECRRNRGIVWRVREPFESSVEMTTNAMIFTDEDGRRVKPLAELPHYEDFRLATEAFAAGNTNAFDGALAVEEENFADGGWKVRFTPTIAAMRQLVKSVEVTGAALPTNAVLDCGDGGVSVIRFKEKSGVR